MFANQFLDYQSWSKEIDEKKKRDEEKRIKLQKRNEKRKKIDFRKYVEKHGNYWKGPAGLLIPMEKKAVPSLDRVNSTSYLLSNNGDICVGQTLAGSNRGGYTDDEYREAFGELREDGKWYWHEYIEPTDVSNFPTEDDWKEEEEKEEEKSPIDNSFLPFQTEIEVIRDTEDTIDDELVGVRLD